MITENVRPAHLAGREPTGLHNADAMIAYAERWGLLVTVDITDTPPDDLLGGYRQVTLKISAPCPERFKGTMLYSDAEFEELAVFFIKSTAKGRRGKRTSAYRMRRWRRAKDLKTSQDVYWEMRSMSDAVERWKQRAEKEGEK